MSVRTKRTGTEFKRPEPGSTMFRSGCSNVRGASSPSPRATTLSASVWCASSSPTASAAAASAVASSRATSLSSNGSSTKAPADLAERPLGCLRPSCSPMPACQIRNCEGAQGPGEIEPPWVGRFQLAHAIVGPFSSATTFNRDGRTLAVTVLR